MSPTFEMPGARQLNWSLIFQILSSPLLYRFLLLLYIPQASRGGPMLPKMNNHTRTHLHPPDSHTQEKARCSFSSLRSCVWRETRFFGEAKRTCQDTG